MFFHVSHSELTHMLLVANFAIEKRLKPWHMGTQLELSSECQHDRV